MKFFLFALVQLKDGLKKPSQLTNVIKRKLVSFVRKSTIAADVLEGEHRLQTKNATRWNSQVKMIRSVLSIPESKLSLLEGAPCLSSYDRNILRDLIEILAPFEEATDFVQTENIPSAGYVLPCVRGLLHHVEQCSTRYHSSFVLALKTSLNRRMPYYQDSETYVLAAMLDPRFKLRWCHEDEKSGYKELLNQEAMRFVSSTSEPAEPEGRAEPAPPKRKKSLFNYMESEIAADTENTGGDIDRYLAASCVEITTNPATYWSENTMNYPSLEPVARRLLSVPSSSAPVERLFSIAGRVFTPIRCQLKDKRFEKLMFIRCNNSVVDK